MARSHLLVLWSRLGNFDRAELDRLLWEERRLFEYWAHRASIVLTDDYPIHQSRMTTYRRGGNPFSKRFKEWAAENSTLRRHVISELRRHGPLPLSAFKNRALRSWRSRGWSAGRDVDRMLGYLWMTGTVMVAGRRQGQRWWDLAERFLLGWTPKDRLSEREVTRRTTQRSLRALGVARLADIKNHFVQGRPGVGEVLTELEKSETIIQVGIKDGSQSWPGVWYVHREDLPLIDRLERGKWSPRATLFSPFDNLIINRARTELLFDFHFRMEIYVPASLRRHGYYVLPVLHGDRLAGRLDVAVDRANGELQVRAAFAEKRADTPEIGKGVAAALSSLASFVGAKRVVPPRKLPRNWKALRA